MSRAMPSTYSTYQEYLNTPEFRYAVQAARRRACDVCEDCNEQPAKHPHHLRYCRWGEFDTADNLVMLCARCHAIRHTCIQCGRVSLKAKHIKAGRRACDHCKGEAIP